MKHLSIYESFYPRRRASSWPKKKHNRGVKILRSLDNKSDSQEIKDLIKKYKDEKGWFDSEKNIDSPEYKIPSDIHWFEILRPDGKNEVVFFDDFDSSYGDVRGEGFVSATTYDEKYEFTMGAQMFNDDVEVDPETLDW